MADFLDFSRLSKFKSKIDELLSGKQDALTAGDNITIENNTISADDEVFDAVYGETSYTDVRDAVESGKIIRLVIGHLSFVPTVSYINDGICIFRLVRREDLWSYEVAPNGEWSFSSIFEYASTAQVAEKQDTLVSGTNIKTINNTSLLGSGNIDINEVFVAVYEQTSYADVKAAIDAHKAIVLDMPANNNQFCITFATYTNGGNALMYAIYKMSDKATLMTVTLTPGSNWTITHTDLQDKLVSGTNIKTINNISLLGNGNIDIQGGGDVFVAEYGVTTYSAIVEAIRADKSIIVTQHGQSSFHIYPPVHVYYTGNNNDNVTLFLWDGNQTTLVTITPQDNWSNSVKQSLGTLTDLTTTNKTNLVGAINEVNAKTAQATENTLGTVKLNPSQNITLNNNGQLEVGGRIGQFEGTTGLFAPNNREPRNVLDYSLLITDALGMDMSANRSMADVSGYGLACKSAAAGSTQYRISNTYANRILAKLCEGGYASRDEATSKVEQIVPVLSVKIGGASYTPDSSANDSSNDIVITTAQTLNPDSAITNIRLFGKMQSYASLHVGNGVKSESGGRSLVLGGGVTKVGSTNDNCLVGNGIYSSGNGNACFGRNHIARKNRGFLAGTGHDTTNARSEAASAVGEYSYMDTNTLFAVGNGSSHTDRKNAFEVRTDGVVLRSPNGTRYKLAVDDSGNLSTTALT